MNTAILRALATAVAAAMLVACAEDENPAPPPRDRSQTTTLKLSASFGSQCARCHGDSGQGTNGYPTLPGKVADENAFIAMVRAGRGDMPAFTETQIADADLKADYATLKTR